MYSTSTFMDTPFEKKIYITFYQYYLLLRLLLFHVLLTISMGWHLIIVRNSSKLFALISSFNSNSNAMGYEILMCPFHRRRIQCKEVKQCAQKTHILNMVKMGCYFLLHLHDFYANKPQFYMALLLLRNKLLFSLKKMRFVKEMFSLKMNIIIPII